MAAVQHAAAVRWQPYSMLQKMAAAAIRWQQLVVCCSSHLPSEAASHRCSIPMCCCSEIAAVQCAVAVRLQLYSMLQLSDGSCTYAAAVRLQLYRMLQHTVQLQSDSDCSCTVCCSCQIAAVPYAAAYRTAAI